MALDQETYNPSEPKTKSNRREKVVKEKTPSKFFDGLTFIICAVVLLGSSAYGARMLLESVVGGIGAWVATVTGLYIMLYTLYKLRNLVK